MIRHKKINPIVWPKRTSVMRFRGPHRNLSGYLKESKYWEKLAKFCKEVGNSELHEMYVKIHNNLLYEQEGLLLQYKNKKCRKYIKIHED